MRGFTGQPGIQLWTEQPVAKPGDQQGKSKGTKKQKEQKQHKVRPFLPSCCSLMLCDTAAA